MFPSREPLSAAQRGKIRRKAQPSEGREAGEVDELNIVPFLDILMNVLMFVLATLAVIFTASIEVAPASPHPPGPGHPPSGFALHVLIVRDGFGVSEMGEHIGPGCASVGAGLTVGMATGAHDYAALADCVRRVRHARPELAGDHGVVVSASPDVPFETVVATMDAVRRIGDEELFSEVSFAIPR
jgi:biopolymer transport protein TolR